jgi:hypothetical protein
VMVVGVVAVVVGEVGQGECVVGSEDAWDIVKVEKEEYDRFAAVVAVAAVAGIVAVVVHDPEDNTPSSHSRRLVYSHQRSRSNPPWPSSSLSSLTSS